MGSVKAAIVVATSPGAWKGVAGLPLALRAARALRAAGMRDVAVFAGTPRHRFARSLRRGPGETPVRWLHAPADAAALRSDPVLIVSGELLFEPATLSPLLEAAPADGVRAARSAASPAEGVVAATCPQGVVPALLAELSVEGATLARGLDCLGVPVAGGVVLGEGLCVPLGAVRSPARLEARLFEDLARQTATGDSYLAALVDRKLSRPLTRLLVRTPATPSQITAASLLVGLAGAFGLATTSYAGRLGGVLLLIVSIVLDCVDGEVARARFEQSPAGARLDLVGDYVVHLATFAGLSIGLWRQGLPPGGVWAAGALFLGVIAAMVVVHGLFIRPALARGGDLHWSGDGESLRGTPVATLVEKLASRDYTYVLLVLALPGRLEWFLYAAAFGTWLFVSGLTGYWAYRRRGSPHLVVTE